MGDLAILNITNDEQPKAQSFDPLPAGVYTCVIEATEVKRNKALTGSFLSVKLQVLDGQYAGRLIFDNITVTHATSEKAATIGRERIVGLARICNVPGQDSQEFVGKTVAAKVKVEEARDGYDAGNRVVAYAAPANNAGAAKRQDVVKASTYASKAPAEDEVPF